MNGYAKDERGNRMAKLADMIVKAKPSQLQFRSEEQFLEMLGMPSGQVPVRVRQLKY
jgi:hypothetical protein